MAAALGPSTRRSALTCVLLMTISLARPGGELLEDLAKHAIERGKRVDDVGEQRQRGGELDRQHELAEDLAGARRDQRRADERAAPAIADELDRAAMKIVDVAAGGLGRIRRGDDDVDA